MASSNPQNAHDVPRAVEADFAAIKEDAKNGRDLSEIAEIYPPGFHVRFDK